MKANLKLILLVVCSALCFSLLTACGGGGDGWNPTGKDVTLIAKGDSAKYLCIYKSGDEIAKNTALDFKSKLMSNGLKCVSTIFGHTSESGDYEILFGETDREASKIAAELLAEKVAENKEAYHWVFYYRDGKLAIVASDELAYQFALEDFFEKYLTDKGIVFKDTLKESAVLTYEEYDEILAEEERLAAEEKKKEHEQYLDELTALLDAQRTELNGVKGTWNKYKPTDSYSNPEIYLFKEYTEDMVYEAANDTIADVYKHQSPAKYPVENTHPRLLLTEDNLLLIRKMLREDRVTNQTFKSLYDQIIPNDCILPAPTSQGTNVTVGADLIHNYSSNYLYIIQAKALAYLLYGDEYYGYQAILYMKNFLKSLDIQVIPSDQCRYYGYVAYSAALVYDWCYDLLDETDKTQFIAGVENCLLRGGNEHSDKMEVGFPPQKQVAIAGHGNEYQILRDYLAFSVAIYDEVPSWYEYVGGRVYNDFMPARDYLYQAGVTWQGTGYTFTRHVPTLFSAWVLQIATGENPYSDALYDAIEGFFNYEIISGYGFSDGDKTADLLMMYDHSHLAYIAAYLYKDPAMLNLADAYFEMDYLDDNKDPYSNSGYGGLQAVSFVVLRGLCELQASDDRYENMDLIKYYGSFLGQYIVRESWNDDSSAAVFMKIKERSTSGHEHLDAGTFEIYYKGMLTSDGGCYNNDGHEHTMYYHDATISHNGLIIYNPAYNTPSYEGGWYSGGQRRVPNTNSMTLEEWKNNQQMDTGKVTGREHGYADDAETQPLYAYLAGDITKAYGESTVSYVGRRMLTVYTGDEDYPMVFFVFDDIFANNKNFEKRFLLQITSENAPTVSGNRVITENGDGCLVLTSLSSSVEIKSVGGRKYKSDGTYDSAASFNYVINGKQLKPLDNGKDDDGHWGRIEIVSKLKVQESTFMNVIYVTDKGNDEIVEVRKLGSANGVEGGIFNEKIAAIFATAREGAKEQLSFSVTGGNSVDYYVSGVTAGEWSVTVDGNDCGTYTATEDGGLLRFTAPAGNVVVTPVN